MLAKVKSKQDLVFFSDRKHYDGCCFQHAYECCPPAHGHDGQQKKRCNENEHEVARAVLFVMPVYNTFRIPSPATLTPKSEKAKPAAEVVFLGNSELGCFLEKPLLKEGSWIVIDAKRQRLRSGDICRKMWISSATDFGARQSWPTVRKR